jgi:hypothetical protein
MTFELFGDRNLLGSRSSAQEVMREAQSKLSGVFWARSKRSEEVLLLDLWGLALKHKLLKIGGSDRDRSADRYVEVHEV